MIFQVQRGRLWRRIYLGPDTDQPCWLQRHRDHRILDLHVTALPAVGTAQLLQYQLRLRPPETH